MNNNINISVIVPVYNCEKYLEQCINSILQQSYKDFELILLNDGSSDSSLEICRKYSDLDNRIVLINQENIGVSNTRKKGITLARGNYICFIDSDDYIDKEYLNVLFQNINEQSIDIVCCNSINFGDKSKEPINIECDEIIKNKERLYSDYFSRYRYTCTLWGKLIDKRILEDLTFPNMRYAEDTFLMLKIFNRVECIKIIKYSGYNYRIQSQSATSTIRESLKLMDILKRDKLAFEICKNYNEILFNKAINRYVDDLYGLVVSFYKEEKNNNDKIEICSVISDNYKYINKMVKVKGIKINVIRLFLFNKNFTKILIRLFYFFK